jgi:hypothetical protein
MNADLNTSTRRAVGEKRASGRSKRFSKAERREAQDRFLDVLSSSGIILEACRAVGIHRTLVHYWNEHDEEFSGRYEQNKLDANDRVRAEIYRRAMQGVNRRRPIYYKGQQVGTEVITEYSDALLIFLARSRMAEFRFSEKDRGDVENRLTVFTITVDEGSDGL